MTTQTFLQVQVLELRHLLEGSEDDPILGPQLRERLADAEEELRNLLLMDSSAQSAATYRAFFEINK